MDETAVRERIAEHFAWAGTDYFGDPFDPPEYRAAWVEPMSDDER